MKFIKIFEEFTEDITIPQSEYDKAIRSLIGNGHKLISKNNIDVLKKSISGRYKVEEQNYSILNPGSAHSIPMLNVTPKSGKMEFLSNINIIYYNNTYYVKTVIRSGDSKFYKFDNWDNVIKLIS